MSDPSKMQFYSVFVGMMVLVVVMAISWLIFKFGGVKKGRLPSSVCSPVCIPAKSTCPKLCTAGKTVCTAEEAAAAAVATAAMA